MMGRKKVDNTIDTFNRKAIQEGDTYAKAQIRETQRQIGRIRAPRSEDADPVYMTVAARNALKNLGTGSKG
ncbi:MAG: hypothetical protein HDR04_09075 [Lachnospiraceae bacterium]|nr:hypothetical protein [Lachnospiraceae bacterium]